MAWVHSDILDNGLNGIKNAAIRQLLIAGYTNGDSYATVTGNAIDTVTMASTDYTLASSSSNRTLTTAAKSGAASASALTIASGTATSGTATTLNDTSKSFTAGALVGKVLTITSGTGSGQKAVITANTTTGVTFAALGTALDATSAYRINPDLYIAFTDGSSKVLWVTNETSDAAINSGDTVNFPALVYAANQPT